MVRSHRDGLGDFRAHLFQPCIVLPSVTCGLAWETCELTPRVVRQLRADFASGHPAGFAPNVCRKRSSTGTKLTLRSREKGREPPVRIELFWRRRAAARKAALAAGFHHRRSLEMTVTVGKLWAICGHAARYQGVEDGRHHGIAPAHFLCPSKPSSVARDFSRARRA